MARLVLRATKAARDHLVNWEAQDRLDRLAKQEPQEATDVTVRREPREPRESKARLGRLDLKVQEDNLVAQELVDLKDLKDLVEKLDHKVKVAVEAKMVIPEMQELLETLVLQGAQDQLDHLDREAKVDLKE